MTNKRNKVEIRKKLRDEWFQWRSDADSEGDIAGWWIDKVLQVSDTERIEGQKDILKLANDLTEKPDRAVRYVPLDKLIEAWQKNN